MTLPNDKTARKQRPLARGLLDYFPLALAEVAHVSYVGNEQHNPGQPMHWAREKSSDHADCILRHLVDRGLRDDDGMLHSAKVAWRALALLQLEVEQQAGVSPPTEEEKKFFSSSAKLPEEALTWGDRVDLMDAIVKADEEALAPDPAVEYTSQGQSDLGAVGDVFFEYQVEARLRKIGCGASLAEKIAWATSYSPCPECGSRGHRVLDKHPRAYIAGPMRGYPEANFPAFDAARDAAVNDDGLVVVSPADIDRAHGLTGETAAKVAGEDTTKFVERDVYALLFAARGNSNDDSGPSRIIMLPGWEASRGATAEFFLARWLGLRAYTPDGEPLKFKDVDHMKLASAMYEYLEGA